MKEEIIKLLIELGSEGITAFYVYLAVDTLQLFIFLSLMAWGISSAWKVAKNNI